MSVLTLRNTGVNMTVSILWVATSVDVWLDTNSTAMKRDVNVGSNLKGDKFMRIQGMGLFYIAHFINL